MNYTVLSTWSLKVAPSKEGTIVNAVTDIKITNVALGDDDETPDQSGRTTVKFVYIDPIMNDSDDEDEGDEEQETTTAICTLSVNKAEQFTTDVVLHEQGTFKFLVSGKNTVYLTGVRIQQRAVDENPYDDSDDDSEDEGAFRLEDISSDVEMDADGMDEFDSDGDRFEEIIEGGVAGKKRSIEAIEAEVDAGKLSKAEKKKAKKQKGQDGKAVEAEVDATKASPAKDDKKKDKKEKAKGGAEKELPGGLRIRDAVVGNGPQAKKNQRIEMRYIGKLANGKIFDSNTKGKPFAFRLGAGEVIKGWDEGIAGMAVGGERVLTIPPALGYGKKASGPIPANSTLTFECKLVSIR